MRLNSRVALALSATAVLALFTGCGATLYDAAGVPQLVLQCTNPQVPVACAQGCVAESDTSCGKFCLDCVGDAAASSDPNASNACDRSSAAIADHACDFTCPTGMQKDVVNKRCACTAATQVRCVGSNACVDQGPTLCGDACEDCTSTPPPAHASRICDVAQRQCDFACDAGSGFAKNPQGDGCACADATKVACGGGAAGGACVAEGVTSCSDACTNCQDPAQFKVNLANVASTTIACNTQASVHQCDWSCPPAANPTFTEKFLNASGQADCRAPSCGGGQHKCPTSPTATACFATNDLNHCGDACSDCAAAIVPAGASPACLPDAVSGFACNFTCPAGTLKSNGACVNVSPAPGAVALGANHTCVITTSATVSGVMCWGANAAGQLGIAGPDRLVAADVPDATLASASYLAAGGDRTCAIVGGGVKCWGGGSATITDQPGIAGATAIAVGAAHTCAIVAGGAVACWGANDKGQAGSGDTATPITVPVRVKTSALVDLTGVTQLATKANHTCALAGTTVYCWGSNTSGQTGVATTTPVVTRATQVAVGTATAVAVGAQHSCAAISGSDPFCWGDRSNGQLGDGVVGSVTPAAVQAKRLSTRADMLALGSFFTCDMKGLDITLRCCGVNDAGQVGASVNNPEPNGIDINIGTPVDTFVAGGDHTCVVAGGVLQCWGGNAHGQLGINSTAFSTTPVRPLPQAP
jgi:alpha-tubulin suppressor-like RCC1 family protein